LLKTWPTDHEQRGRIISDWLQTEARYLVSRARDRPLQDSFLDLIAFRVLNPSLIPDRSLVMDKIECVLRIVRTYFGGSARTFRPYNQTHRSRLTLRVVV